jgi:hypothetical protein
MTAFLTQSGELVLMKGLNFAVTNRVSDEDKVCVAELARPELPLGLGMEFCCVLQESISLTPYLVLILVPRDRD